MAESTEPGPGPGTAGRVSALLTRVNRVAAVAFVVGGGLFALGAYFAQQDTVALRGVNITYLVGGVFFSTGGYASVLLEVNREVRPGSPMRWWGWQARDTGWLSATILFVGTLSFAISLVAAFAEGLTPRQSNGLIWLPDMIGCVCFLVSGHLALREAGGGAITLRPRDRGWQVAAANQVGSWLFFLAGLAAFVRPATSEVVDAGIVNWGTFTGALCFAVAGLEQVFQRIDAVPGRDL